MFFIYYFARLLLARLKLLPLKKKRSKTFFTLQYTIKLFTRATDKIHVFNVLYLIVTLFLITSLEQINLVKMSFLFY